MTSIPLYPRGWFTVHAGLSKYVYQEFGAGVEDTFRDESLPEQYRVRFISDGDDWNVWGETPTSQTRHVQFVTPFLAVALDLKQHLEDTFGDDLVPLEYGDDRYTTTVLSGSEDWATSVPLWEAIRAGDWNIREDFTPKPIEVPPPMFLKVKLGLTAYLTRPADQDKTTVVADFMRQVSQAVNPLPDPMTIGVRSHKVIDIDQVPEWLELLDD